jgi:hypothetical protein
MRKTKTQPAAPEAADGKSRIELVAVEAPVCGCRYKLAARLHNLSADVTRHKHGDIGDDLPALLRKIASVILTGSEGGLLECLNDLEPGLSMAAAANAVSFLTVLKDGHTTHSNPCPPVVGSGMN